ncbi:MAG: TolC family protein [Rhodospirillaceae bacterium]
MRTLVVAAWLAAFAPAITIAQTTEPIRTLEDAQRVGEAHSPRLRAAEARRAAAAGERRQAAARPNPELFLDAENVAGRGALSGVRGAELTAGLSQAFELGGKRAARIAAAEAGLAAAGTERDLEALELRRDIAVAFVAALAATRDLVVEAGRLDNARAVAAAVDERVRNGREPPVQASKARIAEAAAESGRHRAARERDARLAALAAVLGIRDAAVADAGWFDRIEAVAPIDPDAALLTNPAVARLGPLRARAQAELARQSALAIPDLTVRAGVRHDRDADDTSLVFGLSIPLPLFDTNRGNIDRARQELIGAEAEAEALRRSVAGELTVASQRLNAARRTAETLRARIVPAAAEVLAAAQEGYAAGKFGFLELLDAQRTRFDADAALVVALKEYHLARIALMRAAGGVY